MTDIYLKPAPIEIEGETVIALVRDPLTFIPLDPNGEWKTMSQYWARRLRDRDVERADPVVTSAHAPADAPAAPAAFAVCANCVTPDACSNAGRCARAPLA
jgi:hypothetical protein